jgi:hypothetical protein
MLAHLIVALGVAAACRRQIVLERARDGEPPAGRLALLAAAG